MRFTTRSLQFFLIVAGFLPLVLLGLKGVGGWNGLKARLPEAFTHSWQGMTSAQTNPLGVEWFGLAMGLGFTLSFGYWCTNFLVVQRAMAAGSMTRCAPHAPDRGFAENGLSRSCDFAWNDRAGIAHSATNGHGEWRGADADREQCRAKGLIPVKIDVATGKPAARPRGKACP